MCKHGIAGFKRTSPYCGRYCSPGPGDRCSDSDLVLELKSELFDIITRAAAESPVVKYISSQ